MNQEPILHVGEFLPQKPVLAVEYPLPGEGIPVEIRKSLHPWLGQFVGLDAIKAHSLVREWWADIQEDFLYPLRDYLLGFVPRSIIRLPDDHAWLVLADPRFDSAKMASLEGEVGNAWFFLTSPNQVFLNQRLTAFDLDGITGLRTFVSKFGCLSECAPYGAGGFSLPVWWHNLETLFPDFSESGNYGFWKSAVVFFAAADGSKLLLHPSGKTGWWEMEENVVYEFCNDFPAFIEVYTKFIPKRYSFSWMVEGVPSAK